MKSEFPEWMQDESIQDIAPEKLEFLNALFHNEKLHHQKSALLLLPKLLQQAKERNLLFTPDEFKRSIEVIRKRCSKEELEKVDHILHTAKDPK